MWNVIGLNLQMTEGDFGVELPITVSGVTLGAQDSVKFTLKAAPNGETILTKDFSNIQQNTVQLIFTENETPQVGAYVYSLDWYQLGTFMCNIIPCAAFKVVDKA